ncbi:MerR family transcriptional regulator [Gryllotalpicola ginsengisoli]|uniref:helix-turn-helix domain-containing protein n=1 Tax=Gryllotalpicola ginsengisoli TaxID=444608 RepID=UPI0003B72FB6|nr:helix-turn-helix domain-containing protein [Gryllotalpicola ginsengisoli]
MTEMTTTEVARRLGVTNRRVVDLANVGEVHARKLANDVWLIDSDSVLRYENKHRGHAGRALDAATSWAILWELSGLRATWLPTRTYARVRNRLAHLTVDALSRAVASRTKAHRYRSANVERVLPDVIATGRLAVGSLSGALATELVEDRRRVVGYVPRGAEISTFARKHFMVEDQAGQDVLFENTLPIEYASETMPAGVVAADLAVSVDTRERSAGLAALEEMQRQWLARHAR